MTEATDPNRPQMTAEIGAAADQARRPPPALPLSVVTGFLGSGKTTLLNALLRDPALADTVVIINEFGEVGLDHLFIESVDGDMIVLSSGCLCCTIRGDLVSTLENLLRRRDNGRISPFRRVVIETTGLADPAPILHTIMLHPYLMLRFRLDGVITLVDAVNGWETLDSHAEAVKQAAVADRIVLSKSDLLAASDADAHQRLRDRLHALNPSARILDAAGGEITAAALLDAGLFDPAQKSTDVRRWLNAEAFSDLDPHGSKPRSGHGEPDHEAHDVNRHDARIRAFVLRSGVALAPASFDMFLDLLRQAHGPNLLRVKGIVRLSDDLSRPVAIHGVQHVFHPPVRLSAWPDSDTDTRVVFIIRDLQPSFVEQMWGAFGGLVAPDAPDAAALTDNPLAPGRAGLLG